MKPTTPLCSRKSFVRSPVPSALINSAFNRIIYAALLGLVFVASGCQAPSIGTPVTAGQAAPRSRNAATSADAKGSVRAGAAYKKAVAAYRARHFADAKRLVDALLTTPDLSSEDKAFLSRQKQLCQAAVSGKPISATTPNNSTLSGVVSARKRQTVALSQKECGPRALLFLCQANRVPATLTNLSRTARTSDDGTSMEGLATAAQTVGFKAKGVQLDKDALARLSSPAIAWVDGNHYIAVLDVHDNAWTGKPSATIYDPNHEGKEEMAQSELLRRSGGILLTVSQKALAASQ